MTPAINRTSSPHPNPGQYSDTKVLERPTSSDAEDSEFNGERDSCRRALVGVPRSTRLDGRMDLLKACGQEVRGRCHGGRQ